VVTVIDMGLSNLGSVVHALRRIDVAAEVTRDPAVVARATAAVLPGVGAFGDGMASLKEAGLDAALRDHVAAGRPLLGICLGMQLLADVGTEHGVFGGLGLVTGRVVRLDTANRTERVPNIGWCDTVGTNPLGPVPDGGCFYYVHSYHLVPDEPADVAAKVAGFGVQFHPEKSQDEGLSVLESFARQIPVTA
jgi:imidazole glycerol-phosphate synthase subunit HisH